MYSRFGGGDELLNIHQKRTVSGNQYDLLFRLCKGGSDCCWEAEAHGSQPSAGDKISSGGHRKVLGRKNLMTSYIGYQQGLRKGFGCSGQNCRSSKSLLIQTPAFGFAVVPIVAILSLFKQSGGPFCSGMRG